MDIKFWTRALGEAEAELEAATTRTALNAAAKKLMRAKAELKRLKTSRPICRLTGGHTGRPRGRQPNGTLFMNAAGAGLGSPVSRSWCGYWQR